MSQEIVKVEEEILKQIQPILVMAETIEVDNATDVDEGSKFLRKIKDAKIIIEDKRKSFTGPLNESLRNINKSFKDMVKPLDEAEEVVKRKILKWRRTEAERSAEEERILMEARAVLKEAEIELPDIDHVSPMPIENKIGNVQAVKRWTFEVIDADKIPRAYLILNTVSINSMIRQGLRDIPGLRIYQEESLSII